MKKLIKALNEIDVENIGTTKRFLNSLHADVFYYKKHNDLASIGNISRLLRDFVSINRKEFYNGGMKYVLNKRFCNQIDEIIRICDKLQGK